ncbi:PREDICTED: uncharacterized protein LOC109172334 isoform X2 [Ipomoea nil]|uniref:uncharacterized protein LOC109172334 isoform X2 n=1 Tax=Ipomoea nil TaxID=35883 RepID=UPI0009018738|nr:PREDICTED: uncharacterized protein LOC109172334 isoform X2 [Ipomoea nil]
MASDSDEEFDGDDGFEADMEALKRACVLAGASPGHADDDFSGRSVSNSVPSSPDTDDGVDDVELVRDIQKRFALSTDVQVPLDMRPICSLFPTKSGNESEDDIETLRAIERRFASYYDDTTKEELDKELHNTEQVGVTNITSEEESCNNFFLERTNAGEGFPTCVDGNNSALPISEGAIPQDGGAENASSESSGFPKSAQAFVDAIKKNRAFQKLIRSKMIHVEARIEELKKLKDRVKILKDYQVSCRKRTGHALAQKKDARVQLILPRQRVNSKPSEKKSSALYYAPPENSLVASYRDASEKFPVSVNREKWSKEERENLLKGVKQQFQETMFQRAIDLRWLNWEDPLINQEPWSVVEDKNLLHIVQQKGLSNWIDIALSLGTNRTPFQCLARYQRSLNASIIKREWTEEEDNKLRAAVEAFGESNWQVVAASLEGRTGTQCSNRWIKTLHPARQRVGKWTADEDKRLKVAVMLFGPKTWRKIAQYVPGRTHVQCRERWVNSLDPSLNLNVWTGEEDLKLEAAIQEHGYSWSKVAACVAPRTDSQCRRRWKVLFPKEVPLLREARKIQKVALISNFVDRESERPSLKPDDFAPVPLLLQASGSEPSRKRKMASSNMSSDDPTIAENRRYGITYKSRRSRRQPKRKICTNRRRKRPPFANPGMLCNGNELGGGLEFSVAMNNRTSKLPPRKKRKRGPYVEVPEISGSDEIETTNGDDIIFKRSTRGTEFDSGSDNDAKLDASSFPNSISDARTLGGKAMKSRKRSKRRPRKNCSDLYVSEGNHPFPTSRKREGPLRELPGSNLDSDPSGELYDSSLSFEENSELESGAKQVEVSHDRSSPSNNLRTSRCCMQGKKKGLKHRDVDHSNKLAETEDDDSITLAAFLKKSVRRSDHNSNESGAIPECNIHTPTTSRGCGIQGDGNGLGLGPSPPTSEAGIMDDMPLAHFLNTLKRRRVKPATSK